MRHDFTDTHTHFSHKSNPPPISHHSIILNELSNGLKLSQLSAAEALGEREYVQGSPRK